MGKVMSINKNTQSDVLEHIGDILYRLNRKEEAFEYWNKAKEKGEGSEFLNKKIKNQKLYE
jgi:predicted negative regulator of RcsB-dependent stress response